MQRPSFAEWIIPIIFSAVAVITSWAGHNMQMTWWAAILAYALLLLLAITAHLCKLREYKKWLAMNSVIMMSHGGDLVFTPAGSQDLQSLGHHCFLTIRNLSARKVKVTSLWLEGCAADGGDLYLRDDALDRYLDAGEAAGAKIPKNTVHREDWFDKGRARLSDGSTIRSTRDDEVPQYGNLGPGELMLQADPRSPQPPKRGP